MPRTDVAAGVIVRRGKVLISRRPVSAPLGGLWEFPGGKVEAGEDPVDALARELEEELAIEVRVGRHWGTLAHRYAHGHVRLHFYFASLVAGEPRAIGCEEFRWADPCELDSLAFPEADRPLLDDLVRKQRAGLPLDDPHPPSPGRPEENE